MVLVNISLIALAPGVVLSSSLPQKITLKKEAKELWVRKKSINFAVDMRNRWRDMWSVDVALILTF
jgi:hypothetical protein